MLALEQENQSRAHLLTKIAGNYKKAENADKCIQSGTEAFNLLCQTLGEKDLQSCRALVNLAGIHAHFENSELALEKLQQFSTLFEQSEEMQGDKNFIKLKEMVDE